VKVPGGWTVITGPLPAKDELIDRQVELLLHRGVKRHVSDVVISLEEENRLDRVLHIRVKASGRSHKTLPSHEESYPVEVRFSHGTCDTCGMMSGGYYNAILQIRADNRPLTEYEEEKINTIVTQRTVEAYGKDVKAFITSASKDRHGLDFRIGSEHLCRRLADEIERTFLADKKVNYKLVGQKGGKDQYRTTILLRLHRFVTGDFIRVATKPCQIQSMSKSGISCYDLAESSTFTINPKSSKWKGIEFLAPSSESRQCMVISRQPGQPAQLMDSKTYEILEVEDHLLNPESTNGSVVHVVRRAFLPLPEIYTILDINVLD
jgi:nonsense-mediated mRNA decay protein 3